MWRNEAVTVDFQVLATGSRVCFREGIGFGVLDPPSFVHKSSLFVFPLMLGRKNVKSQPPTESRRRPMNHFSGWDPAEHCTKEGLGRGGSLPLEHPSWGVDQLVLIWRWQVGWREGDTIVEPPGGFTGRSSRSPSLSFHPRGPSMGIQWVNSSHDSFD